MNTTDISRKDFLSGALASLGLGFLGGRSLFAVPPGWTPQGALKLTFGIVSDTHIRRPRNDEGVYYFWQGLTDKHLRNAFAYFKRENVDAVMHCGDWADRGSVKEIEAHKTAWDDIFTPNGTINGKKVETLFVTGNHDFFQEDKWTLPENMISLPRQDANGNMVDGVKYHMERIWGETYEDVWHKIINGYHFFGYGYRSEETMATYEGDGKEYDLLTINGLRMAELIRRTREDPTYEKYDQNFDSRPFFTTTHIRPIRYNRHVPLAISNALGAAEGEFRKGLFFFGHGHRSIADWPAIEWLGGTSCYPAIQCTTLAADKLAYFPKWPRAKTTGGEGNTPVFAQGFGDGTADGENDIANHGMLVKVYTDAIVIHRVDFSCDVFGTDSNLDHHCSSLGPDWVLPLEDVNPGGQSDHPFTRNNLTEVIGAPEFRGNAELGVYWEEESVRIVIPKADGNLFGNEADGYSGSRVYGYNVEVLGTGGVLRRNVYADGYNLGIGYEPNGGVTTVVINYSELPKGNDLTFRVWPCSSLATRGKPIDRTEKCIRVCVTKSVPNVGRDARFVLTDGANLADDAKIVPECPPWVKRVCVEDGEIVAYTRPIGATVNVK